MSRGNEPAFPSVEHVYGRGGDDRDAEGPRGVTMLEWYAGQVLVGIIAGEPAVLPDPAVAAKMSFGYAEAMIAEGAKRKAAGGTLCPPSNSSAP